jgi:hypothetical protein
VGVGGASVGMAVVAIDFNLMPDKCIAWPLACASCRMAHALGGWRVHDGDVATSPIGLDCKHQALPGAPLAGCVFPRNTCWALLCQVAPWPVLSPERVGPTGGPGRDQWTGVWFADKERASQQTAGRLLYVRVDMTCTDGVQRVCFENAACSCVWSAASSSRSTGCEAVV